ncbi:protein kinase domain protein [Ichthyophthirius multifiliis]|uniref:Protein kinase domain protein n=1 Tax=Ichthyophthirius multifiliis TaxID=5932 RepID=G0QWP2_ICHMU|nr:protein kinase domain protein [Ichthyophthirius multifiliis]EGR30357.1 protein kinase domain protein [Ichthyophthirius multifiliis]|eukprot:XP_004031944.1 protein kinase domain protein [Ichthyophthirius multifiliis]
MSSEQKQIRGSNNTIYQYKESDQLGSGSFASVFKGTNNDNGQEVAIKVINRQALKKYGDEIIQAIGDEVNILQQIALMQKEDPCPFIVKIYDCFQTTNNIYIVLEYCNQGNLLNVLKQPKYSKGIPEQEAIRIFFQIVSSIYYLSKYDIVHRDIKPENIFINNGVYKLGDFGFASQKKLYQTTLGTYPYMAPEFFKEPSYDKLVDVWAVGIMYHEMLFNELYFMGTSQFDVSQKICNKAYIIKCENLISKQSQDILKRSICKDRSLRITAEQLYEHEAFSAIKKDSQILKIIQDSHLSQQNLILIG